MLRREHVHSGRMELAPHREERADASQFVRKHGVLKGMKVFEEAEELPVESLCDVLDKVCKVPSRSRLCRCACQFRVSAMRRTSYPRAPRAWTGKDFQWNCSISVSF